MIWKPYKTMIMTRFKVIRVHCFRCGDYASLGLGANPRGEGRSPPPSPPSDKKLTDLDRNAGKTQAANEHRHYPLQVKLGPRKTRSRHKLTNEQKTTVLDMRSQPHSQALWKSTSAQENEQKERKGNQMIDWMKRPLGFIQTVFICNRSLQQQRQLCAYDGFESITSEEWAPKMV